MKPYISMITLGVADLARSIRFYEDGLGFPRIESAPEIAFFSLNGSWLGLYGRDALADDAMVSAQGSGFPGFALSHNLDSPAAVDEAFAAALKVGAQSVKPPEKVFWGGYSGYFKDPDGFLWELAHNPYTQIGPQDV